MAGPQSAPTAGYDNFEIARRLWISASYMGRIDADDELPQRIVRHAEFELLALAGDWWNVRPLPDRLFFQAPTVSVRFRGFDKTIEKFKEYGLRRKPRAA